MEMMELRAPALLSDLQTIAKGLKVTLPEDYIQFMLLHNGGEGPVGDYGYLAVFSTDEIAEFYQEPGAKDAMPGFFFFASDLSGYLYAYDLRAMDATVVEIPDDISDASEIKPVAHSFAGFIDYIYQIDDSDFEDILREGELK